MLLHIIVTLQMNCTAYRRA